MIEYSIGKTANSKKLVSPRKVRNTQKIKILICNHFVCFVYLVVKKYSSVNSGLTGLGEESV
jgi:hypothetical protein